MRGTAGTLHGWRGALAALALAVLMLGLAAPTGAIAATFGPPTVVTDRDLSEPGIDIAPDGTIYVNAIPGLSLPIPGHSAMFRSDDGGATWVDKSPNSTPGGGDVDIAVDPVTGALAVTDLWLGSATVGKSTNRGDSWQTQPIQGVVVQDRNWVASSGNGVVYHVTNQLPLGLFVSRSTNGGLLYLQHTLAASVLQRSNCICAPGTIVAERMAAGRDNVGVIHPITRGGLKFARSTNSARSFQNVDVRAPGDGEIDGFPIVANAGGGHLHAVWNVDDGSRAHVEYARSDDWGASWTAPRTIVSSGTPVFPWVDARGGKVAVSLYHTPVAATPATAPADAAWFESYLESTDGGNTFSGLQTVDPRPVKHGPFCADVTCEENRELGDFQSVALDPQGRPNLTWDRLKGDADVEVLFARGS